MGALVPTRPTFFQRAAQRLGITPADFGTVLDPNLAPSPKKSDPITLTVTTKFVPRERHRFVKEELVKADLNHRIGLWNLSHTNGPASVIIDAYNHSIWTNGYRIESDNKPLAEAITKRLHLYENQLKQMTEDGFRFGYGVGEKARTRDPFNPRLAIVPRCARQFDILIDKYGLVLGIRQYDNQGKPMQDVSIEQSIVLMPIVDSEGSGRSVLDACLDPLIWYDKIGVACADAIGRHGNTIFNIQLAGPDGQMAPLDAMNGMEGVTTDLNSKAELITNVNTQIKELNQAGVPHVEAYKNWVLAMIVSSSGVPEEFFGLGAGKTGMLANSKKGTFYDRIQSAQHSLEPQIDDQIIDVIAREFQAAPGDAHFLFNNPNTENDLQKAQYCKAIMEIDPFNPLVPHSYLLDYLGISFEEIQNSMLKEQSALPAPLPPPTNQPTPGGENPGLTG